MTFEIGFKKNQIFLKKTKLNEKWGFRLVKSLKNHVFYFSNKKHAHQYDFLTLISNFKNTIFGRLSGQSPKHCPKVLFVQKLHHILMKEGFLNMFLLFIGTELYIIWHVFLFRAPQWVIETCLLGVWHAKDKSN